MRVVVYAVATVVVASAVSTLIGPVGYPPGTPRPPLAPPPWAFGVVWPVLYATIGVALATAREPILRAAVLANLALNLSWLVAFRRSAVAGLGVLVALTGLTWALVVRGGLWVLLPYALWLSFATYLNAWIAGWGAPPPLTPRRPSAA